MSKPSPPPTPSDASSPPSSPTGTCCSPRRCLHRRRHLVTSTKNGDVETYLARVTEYLSPPPAQPHRYAGHERAAALDRGRLTGGRAFCWPLRRGGDLAAARRPARDGTALV